MRNSTIWPLVLALAGVPVMLTAQSPVDPMRGVAERYVKLVLAVGQHDADYVDAFYGPAEWRTKVEAAKVPLAALDQQAEALEKDIAAVTATSPVAKDAELWVLRRQYLARQMSALRARVAMLQGKRLTFDEESRALYDAVAPTQTEVEFEAVLTQLDARLPGEGSLIERYDRFKQGFVIPTARVDRVFREAIRACRDRTQAHMELPVEERFTVEYVTGKSWSGYNWYQGNYKSLIQVNTDLPIYVDRAIDLACHEGYPGHHVYNVLLEKNLVRDRGWIEYTVYPLFSPQSLIAEGTANYGIDVAFPTAERITFEREVLFPLAGLDGKRVQEYYDVLALVDRLSYAGNEAARRYIDGTLDRAGAVAWLEKYALYTAPRAEQRVKFIDQYRSYVINYNLGKDLIRAYLTRKAGNNASATRLWAEFGALLSSPRLPSELK
ncbi:MAG: hypothetical protein Q8O42_12785 [Acidobacteriota bacterium]|nr:hypothetical protein [Acidobacteriota bacterium]